MFLFTSDERKKLKIKAQKNPWIFGLLKNKHEYPRDNLLIVPKISKGDWGMYYNCSEDMSLLCFNPLLPHKHICPVCKKEYSGGHYDGAWESRIHNLNADEALRLAYLFTLTDDKHCFDGALRILKKYSECYPDYREHGNIPYNGPGLAFAQTLDEAVFMRKLGYAYDLISDYIADDVKNYICERLFKTASEFMLRHRSKQIHNHEVLINASIGIIAIITGDTDALRKAIYEPFGLNDQRKRGVLSDGMWFEGSVSYHDYALSAFFGYEIFARHTSFSNLDDVTYLKMLKFVGECLTENDEIPALNDSRCRGGKYVPTAEQEFGYVHYRDEELLSLLCRGYKNCERKSIEAFFYGAEKLEGNKMLSSSGYHNSDGSGLTVIRGDDSRMLLVKHSPFGGEHDHYDRLAISLWAFGESVMPDFGTVNYGLKQHTEYFKNTFTHNTVSVNGKNQPPQNCCVNKFISGKNSSFLDVYTDWGKSYEPLSSYVIKEWDEKSYENTFYRRQILWKNEYFIDVVFVSHPSKRPTELVFHIDAELISCSAEAVKADYPGDCLPASYMKDMHLLSPSFYLCGKWRLKKGFMNVHSFTEGCEVYMAKGMDNTGSYNTDFVIQRQNSEQCVYVNIFETYCTQSHINDVKINSDGTDLTVTVNSEQFRFEIKNLREEN